MVGPHLSRITVYPVKSLDGKSIETTTFTSSGGLDGDRLYALFDSDGEYVNGKAEERIHRIRSGFDRDTHRLCVRDAAESTTAAESFALPDESAAASSWFSEYFGYDVTLRRDHQGFPDDTSNPGPTVISRATIETIADWYDDISTDGMRRRLRANIEIAGVPAFWEDRLFGDAGEVVRFSIGDAILEGVTPCARCVVPSRNPDTGDETPGFRERFIEQRRATLPDWTASERYDHDYRVMVNTRVPDTSYTFSVGDPVAILDTHPA